ncbi:MAG: hypothetical protein GY794_24705, partial [bacterium]|nr:hypothetical protein [bacterium]
PPPVTPPPVAIAVETPDPVPPDPTEPKAQPVVQDNSASDAAQYASDLEAIINADNSSQQQDNLIDQMTERLYDLNVTIKSTSWTLDFSMLPEYRNGRTIIATVQDAGDAEIAIHFPEEANSKISSLPKGTTLHLAVRPREFNKFYKRMEAMAENP